MKGLFLTAFRSPALAIAHPGHELRVFGWLTTTRPIVFVLTDGGGSVGRSRLASTSRILGDAKARVGSIYGRVTDQAMYQAILNGDTELFTTLATDLAEALLTNHVDFVAGDAIEGYNPTHDVWRLIINAAVTLANYQCTQKIENRDFPLIGPPDHTDKKTSQNAFIISLDTDLFEKKISAAQAYYELTGEVTDALNSVSQESFKKECFRTAPLTGESDGLNNQKPYYESYGERKVATGTYKSVIRRQEHVLPIARALSAWIKKNIE